MLQKLSAVLGAAALVALVVYLLWSGGAVPAAPLGAGSGEPNAVAGAESADLTRARADTDGGSDADRVAVGVVEGGTVTAVRGIVLDARTLQPLAGVEVAAMKTPPSIERFVSRIRNAFVRGDGLFTQSSQPAEILARTTTAGDGTFELTGLEPGVVFLDARADFTFVRTPAQVRIARGETIDGVELLGSPGGRVQGVVRGPDGAPLAGAVVSLRPGLNAFLGQMTQRRYRWLEAVSDADGEYDLVGVPEGNGYVVSAAGPGMALEEVFGIEVREGSVARVDFDGHPGARVAGTVLGPDGAPIAGARVAMVYLDVSRVLFSADGRAEPIATDAAGRFALDHVAAGRIGFVAVADDVAPSAILDLTVVDDGVYEDLVLQLVPGEEFTGRVVDDTGAPVADALIEVRPIERPNDPDVVKMALKVRELDVRTGLDGRFRIAGVQGERLFVQVSKPRYVTEVRFGIPRSAEQEFEVRLTRGATVSGRVLAADGTPLRRFSIDTRSREVDPETGEEIRPRRARRGARDGDAEAGVAEGGRGGPPWMRQGGMRLAEGERLGDRQMGDRWTELAAADGRFELTGLPPGKIRVRVRAEGYRDPEPQEVVLAAGARSDELTFTLEPGATATGRVIDAATGAPVPDAMVTAYRDRDAGGEGGGGERGGLFRMNIDPEDFDLLGMAEGGRRSTRTDSGGRFELVGLAEGSYRFTARHPDRVKASEQGVEIGVAAPPTDIVIQLGSGGSIQGTVTGAGMQPLADAVIVALSIQAGSFESASTDRDGRYRIDGLAPGSYVVFKSRVDERATNLGYDILGNMRLKNVRVRDGEVATLDIQDETEDGVRVYGQVLDGGEPVSRAMVTALGEDRQGLLGMGIRAQPTDAEGRFEMVLSPGSYWLQVTRFAQRPQQASLSLEVPEGVVQMRYDVELPRSLIAGRVIDSSGQPVAGIQVSAGLEEGGVSDAPGLLGLLAKNGVSQSRTGEDGAFRLDSLAPGTYRVTASGRGFGRRSGSVEFGEAMAEGLVVDGGSSIEGLTIVIPRAGRITGTVVDGNGNPVRGAEIVASREDADAPGADPAQAMLDLFGVQAAPVRSDADGRFELAGVTPGTYRVRADADGLSPGVADDVVVAPEGVVDVQLRVLQGATLKVRARNIRGEQLPLANITVLDGQGKPLASRISVTRIFRSLVGGEGTDDTGWRTIGNVPPDTYTVIVNEPGQPELRVSRTIRDGETVEWDIDVALELEASGRARGR